jgi:hypothetical protein
MGLGMIGAIGGVGQGLVNQGQFLAEEEKAVAADTRTRNLQGWLAQQREQFAIAAEGRAAARRETEKDSDFERTKREAPDRRQIAAEDVKGKKVAESEAARDTLEDDATVAARMTEAKQTEADKKLKGAQADYYSERNDTTLAGKKGAAAKLDPADNAELADIKAAAKGKRDLIDKGRADGTWDDSKLTPGQQKMQAEVIALEKRQRAILGSYREGAAPGAKPDPVQLRKPAASPAPAGPAPATGGAPKAVRTSMKSTPEETDRALIFNNEYRDAHTRLKAAASDEERQRAQGDISALEREAKGAGITLNQQPAGGGMIQQAGMPAAPRPPAAPVPVVPAGAAAPAAAPASPFEALGQQVDATRRELSAATEPSRRPGLKAGPEARQQYTERVEALRAKLRGQEGEYQRAVGQQQPAFRFASP